MKRHGWFPDRNLGVWVTNEHCEMAIALAELLKLRVLTDILEEEV